MNNEEQELATLTLTPTAAAVFSNPIEAQTLGLNKAQSEIVLSAYDDAYNGDRTAFCPHYAMSANDTNKKLKFDLTSVPLTFSMDFHEFIHVVAKPNLEGLFEGLEFFDVGIRSIKETLLLDEEIDQLEAVVICYQLNNEGERIENANDIEINVSWHASMTETSDYRLIEKLFFDMVDINFSAEDLNQSLALFNKPTE